MPINRLLSIMSRLRDPNGGCPWDLEQSFKTIAPYTIEEAYEVIDAIERDDMDDLRGELGDLLFQVVFHAQMAKERGAFAFDDVVNAICEKMERRQRARRKVLATKTEERGLLIVHTGAGAPYALPSLYISVARRFPNLRIILAHAGGGIYSGECIVAADVCPNIYVELSSLVPHQLTEVVRHLPSERLMIGSDLLESTAFEIGKIVELNALSDVKKNILWNTAESLFGG